MTKIDKLKREKNIPVILADSQGFITYVNDRFEEVFGWTLKDLDGKALTTIMPNNFRDAHNLGFSRFLITGKPTLLDKPIKLKILAKDGREFDTEHFIVAEQHQNQWIFGATIRPF